ncbi:hypothetical protein PUR61_35580 [Streptomyces sp. BE20]|uniref:hypothetical protein n=1 Tax=Streptomyces sp. BE20 TaxID=3002525 RepID=UPI002E794A1B|nr:hypothetical protein [Streptomyces sp. BE20]MEE1827469.1 hypothetical protein [Streptomyces sp. BE20]
MQSARSGSVTRLAVVGVVAAVLALSACGPENDDSAVPPPPTRPTTEPVSTPSAGQPAAPTTARPTAPPTATAPSSASAKPTAPTSPTGKRQVVEARTAGGLARATGPDAVSDVPVDPGEMRDGMHLVVANYDRAGQTSGRRILLVAVDNVPEDPAKRREHLWRGLIDYAQQHGSTGDPTSGVPYAAGPLGGSLECLQLPAAPTTDVLCGWSDASTAGVALFPKSTPAEAAALFAGMRGDIEK